MLQVGDEVGVRVLLIGPVRALLWTLTQGPQALPLAPCCAGFGQVWLCLALLALSGQDLFGQGPCAGSASEFPYPNRWFGLAQTALLAAPLSIPYPPSWSCCVCGTRRANLLPCLAGQAISHAHLFICASSNVDPTPQSGGFP